MDRFLLDLENLPKAKKEVIFQITSSYPDKRKVAFLKSLIFLGFSNIKQADIDIATANIGKSTTTQSQKYRVILTNTPIADFLKSIKNKSTKRSCVYAFLYAGITSYIEYMRLIENGNEAKSLEIAEKKLFLCGLGEHLNTNLSISIKVDKEPTSTPTVENKKNTTPAIHNTQPQDANDKALEKATHTPPPSPTPKVDSKKDDGFTSSPKKKIQFTTDGV